MSVLVRITDNRFFPDKIQKLACFWGSGCFTKTQPREFLTIMKRIHLLKTNSSFEWLQTSNCNLKYYKNGGKATWPNDDAFFSGNQWS